MRGMGEGRGGRGVVEGGQGLFSYNNNDVSLWH